jgi:polar amino acid transport system substrate-binding protein
MELAYPPFEMTDPRGKPTGVSVDHRDAIWQILGAPGRHPEHGLRRADPGAEDRQGRSGDFVDDGHGRARQIDRFLRSLHLDRAVPPAQEGFDSAGIADLDKDGVKVAVKKGTTGHLYATNNLKKAQVLVLDKESAAVLEVAQGKADAFIYDQMSTYQNWQRNKETTRAILEPFQKESWAVGLRKGNDELKAGVNRFIKAYREEGGFEQLGERYLKEMKDEFKRLGSAFFL